MEQKFRTIRELLNDIEEEAQEKIAEAKDSADFYDKKANDLAQNIEDAPELQVINAGYGKIYFKTDNLRLQLRMEALAEEFGVVVTHRLPEESLMNF